MRRAASIVFAMAALLAGSGGCAHLQGYSGPPVNASATPTSTASATALPSSCPTQNPSAVQIPMSSSFVAASTPPYGYLAEYGQPNTSDVSGTTAPIALRSGDVLQFFNGESNNGGTAVHSAAAVQTAAFPAVPFTFPAPEATALGTTIASATAAWSTGRIAASDSVGNLCYSQSFTLTAPNGTTIYFGDLDYYDAANARDVIVVSASAPFARRRP